jgi:hypothetical protein
LPENPRPQHQQESDEAFDFLKRLIFASYDDNTPEKLGDVMREADVWLDSQPPDSVSRIFPTILHRCDRHAIVSKSATDGTSSSQSDDVDREYFIFCVVFRKVADFSSHHD